jgi:hypothetical protein
VIAISITLIQSAHILSRDSSTVLKYTCLALVENRNKNKSDYYCGFNVSMGWGSYSSSKLVLWDLKLALETRPGDTVFFISRTITYSTVDIRGGVRNMINCFVHETPLSWKDRKHKELIRYDQVGKIKKRQRPSQDSAEVRQQKVMQQQKQYRQQ